MMRCQVLFTVFEEMIWKPSAAVLWEAGEISKEDYDKWRYYYPEFDATQR